MPETQQILEENLSQDFKPAPADAAPVVVALPNGYRYSIPIDAKFDKAACRAVEYIRNRRQWRKLDSARAYILEILNSYFPEEGLLRDEALERMALAGLVEIQINRKTGESAFAFPWEFAISEITAKFRQRDRGRSRPLVVVRRLIDPEVPALPQNLSGIDILVIKSAPGAIGDFFSFDSEDRLMRSSFSTAKVLQEVTNPTLAQLQTTGRNTPHNCLVHFTGVDALQGASLIGDTVTFAQRGVYLAGPDGEPQLGTAAEVAEALTSGQIKPLLVSFNFYNSAWSLASETVSRGAVAAIGFQDEIDDALAEIFFSSLYEAWERSEWNLMTAYREALRALDEYAVELRGTGIVLWSASSFLDWAKQPSSEKRSQAETLLRAASTPDLNEAIQVAIRPCAKLNYSMLHNNRPLFDRFEVKRQIQGRLMNVRIEVLLDTGSAAATYSTTFDLNRARPMVDVSSLARVSLTSEMALSLRESVYTSLRVSVWWEERLVYQNSFRVALLPTDEWRDDDLNRIWLPSFVLPRDPVIPEILDRAQHYLSALQDDSGAGFDGYQGVLLEGLAVDQRAGTVDDQVKAIWWTLLQDYRLSYINPPPSFSDTSQRLRIPSSVIAGRRGTCIDLALLLAALLEFIDVYPVVFLLRGHAFPGYVRSAKSYNLLRRIFLDPALMAKNNNSVSPGSTVRREWILDKAYYSPIVELVRQGHIVPIETVSLTQHTGFSDAIDEGMQNLTSKEDFEYLVDIKSAREADVTPIPLWSVRS